MQIPLQITFRGMQSSPAVDAAIRDKAGKLEHFHPRILSCRVVVEQPDRIVGVDRRHQPVAGIPNRLEVPGCDVACDADNGKVL